MIDGFEKLVNVENMADIKDRCEYFKRWKINAITVGTGNIMQNFERNVHCREYEGDIIFKIDNQSDSIIIEVIDWKDEKEDFVVPIFIGDKIFMKEETLEVLINILNGIKIEFDSLSSYKKALAYLYLVSNKNEYKYLFDNDSVLSEFEKIEIEELPNAQKVFCEYFSNGHIKKLNAGVVNITEFEPEEAVKDNVGSVVLGVCINEGIGGESVAYATAIRTSQYIELYIKVEDDGNVLWEYFDPITDNMRVLSKKDSYEVYIENEYGGAINFKFESSQEYENALTYIMLAGMKKDYSYLENSRDRRVLQENNIEEESPYDKLENLVGLEEIKSDVLNLVNLMKMQIRRKNQGLKIIPVSLHIVFSGNPGTGKTTVARILAGIYKDIGTQTIAIVSQTDVKILELADKVQNIENQKQKLLRKMDRSRRATNLNNYNEDGTIKKQGNKKVKWNKSNHYVKYQNKLKELYRKQADVRKYQHECLTNYIISLGNKVYVEKMNFAGLQRRSKNTEKNEQGKFKRKKRFGKSLANKAPSMLLTIIDRKLKYFGEELIEINTFEAKASQFNHFDSTYTKKALSQRWNDFDGIKIQRDVYSAFLIMNIADDLKSFDIEKCNERFENFLKLHNLEVDRLKGHKNLSSIAI